MRRRMIILKEDCGSHSSDIARRCEEYFDEGYYLHSYHVVATNDQQNPFHHVVVLLINATLWNDEDQQ